MNADALKLTSYFGERQRTADNGFAADALLDLYGQQAIATSILLRGVEGFGARPASAHRPVPDPVGRPAADRGRGGHPAPDRGSARADLGPAPAAGWSRWSGHGCWPATSRRPGRARAPDEETKLTVYLGRQERVYRVPAFVAICDLLHRRGIAGATALLGVDGTAHGQRERAAFFSRNAATPMMVIAVGSGTRIAQVLPELGGLLRRPLLTLERVRICKRDGELLCRRPSVPGAAAGRAPACRWRRS